MGDDSRLTVTASLRSSALDARRGVVRLHPDVLRALGSQAGSAHTGTGRTGAGRAGAGRNWAALKLTGTRTTAALAAPAPPTTARDTLLCDDLTLGNLAVRDGTSIGLELTPAPAARRIRLSGPPEIVAAVTSEHLRWALLGKVVCVGDDVSLLPQDVLPAGRGDDEIAQALAGARQRIRTAVGFAWTTVLLTVVDGEANDPVTVTMDTDVRWADHSDNPHTGSPGLGSGGLGLAGFGSSGLGSVGLGSSGLGPVGLGPVGLGSADQDSPGQGSAGQRLADHGTADHRTAGAVAAPAPAYDITESTSHTKSADDAAVADSADHAPAVADLPGLRGQAGDLREWLDLGFGHTDLLARLGTTATMGVLVSGPAGSGKSTMVRAVAAELDAAVVRLNGQRLAGAAPDAAAAVLWDALSSAADRKPAVLLIQDVEALAPRGEQGTESPLITVLLEVIAAAIGAERVAVVCTTGRPEQVDPRLRHPGRLDRELSVGLPDRAARHELLTVLTRSMPLDEDVPLGEVAGGTPGFVIADLLALVREAGVRAAARQREVESPTVSAADFTAALEVVHPTSMADGGLEVTDLTLADVGDMTEVKEALTETVLWPLSYPDTFDRLGIDPPRGVLLFGPPGCGKTFLVRALAGSGGANVLSVKGAELLTKWVGESERAVRELFRRAREAAPTMVFLDEVDALAPVRGQATDGGTTDRVVAALLTELDGAEKLRNVVVVAATNRPELVDPALLRPGRLERLVYVPPPDATARAEILRAAASDVPLASAVDLDALGATLEGYSAADCAAVIRESALAAMRESLASTTVSAAHVAMARERVRPSLDPAQLTSLAAYADRITQ